jgi:hypothetical protein
VKRTPLILRGLITSGCCWLHKVLHTTDSGIWCHILTIGKHDHRTLLACHCACCTESYVCTSTSILQCCSTHINSSGLTELQSGHTLMQKQFPLTPTHATNFNSCQGLTLDCVGVDSTRLCYHFTLLCHASIIANMQMYGCTLVRTPTNHELLV